MPHTELTKTTEKRKTMHVSVRNDSRKRLPPADLADYADKKEIKTEKNMIKFVSDGKESKKICLSDVDTKTLCSYQQPAIFLTPKLQNHKTPQQVFSR